MLSATTKIFMGLINLKRIRSQIEKQEKKLIRGTRQVKNKAVLRSPPLLAAMVFWQDTWRTADGKGSFVVSRRTKQSTATQEQEAGPSKDQNLTGTTNFSHPRLHHIVVSGAQAFLAVKSGRTSTFLRKLGIVKRRKYP